MSKCWPAEQFLYKAIGDGAKQAGNALVSSYWENPFRSLVPNDVNQALAKL